MSCQRCGGPTEGQNILRGNHRHFPDCIAFLKKELVESQKAYNHQAHCGYLLSNQLAAAREVLQGYDNKIDLILDALEVARSRMANFTVEESIQVDAALAKRS